MPLLRSVKKTSLHFLGIIKIMKNQIEQVQNEWGNAVVAVGKAFIDKSDYRTVAEDLVKKFYGYELFPVLFKPTLAVETPFRNDFEAALSYFIGANSQFSEDKGFAIRPWTKVVFENNIVTVEGDLAFANGIYHFTDLDGEVTSVEYTFGYKLVDDFWKISIHHSSLPIK